MGMRGYKTELDLNHAQITACKKHAGCARFAYNWGLSRKQAARQAGVRMPSARDLHKELNRLKATDFPWMYEVSKCAPQEALISGNCFPGCEKQAPGGAACYDRH